MSELEKIIKDQDISIGILTVPPENAADVAETLIMAGIKGILNYTSTPLNVSPNVYLEEYDMITSIEKVAYFVKEKNV
jgi:redox-sensing transcriptional repressor